jgi:hypothetical protein
MTISSVSTFDYFSRQEKPSMSLCNPDHAQLYSLNTCYDTQLKLRWNATSEFLFTISQTVNGVTIPAFDYIEGKRVVLIDTVGYFIINDVQDDFDGSVPIKTVTCLSQEFELVSKKLTLFSGTFQFYDSASPLSGSTLIASILPLIPNWSIGTVDPSIAGLYRTFNVSDTNIYQFLTTDVSIAYNCVFIFDYMNQEISIISKDKAPPLTDIFLSFDNLIKKTNYKEITTEISTCLYCYGGGDLTIRDVNPIGTNGIYDFTYYKTAEWMSGSLINSIDAWENKFTSSSSIYANLLLTLSDSNIALISASSILNSISGSLAVDQQVRAARIQQGLDTTDIDAKIAEDLQLISDEQVIISSINQEISTTTSQLTAINTDLSFSNIGNFTPAQYLELQNFIFENTYKNDNIITTDIMTYAEIQAQSQQLYEASLNVLSKAAIPRYQITIDSVNFLALIDFMPFIQQLQLGCQITVDSGRGYFFNATLLEYDFSYDQPDQFTIILSNRQRLDDSHFIFSDIFGQSIQNSSNVNFIQTNWNDWSVNKSNIIGNVLTSDGGTQYGIKSDNIKGIISANSNLAITNINSTTGSSNFQLDHKGVVIRDPSIYVSNNLGIDANLPLAGGGQLVFRSGIFLGGSGIAIGSNLTVYDDVTSQIATSGTYFTLTHTYLNDSLRVYMNGLLQRRDYSYSENVDMMSFTMIDPAIVGDTLIAEYVPLI